MADNVELDAGTGGAVMATDDVAAVHYPISKLAYGALDSVTLAASGAGNVSAGVPRVTLASDDPAVVDLAAIEIATEATQAAVEIIDDAVYVDDADWTDGTSKHVLVGGLYQSTPQTVTDGDVAPANITANGALHVAVQNAVTVDLGANNDVTVTSGTVTANLGATDNAVLDAIAASAAAIDTDATTIIGHLDGVETLLGTIDADSSTLAGAVAGTEMQVDVVAALPAGTNAIGKLAANSGVDIGDVDVTSISAGTNLIGQVYSRPTTGAIYNGTTSTTPVFAAIDVAGSGDNTIVAAAGASNKIRVYSLYLVSAGTVTVRFESGAAGTALSGQMSLVANTGFVLPYNPLGWFETAANTLLNLELSDAISVDGGLVYSVVQ